LTQDSKELLEDEKAGATALLHSHFGPGTSSGFVSVPGRVNLIGEHIDYHGLPVLPMALQRRVYIGFRRRNDRQVRAVSSCYGEREFPLCPNPEPGAPGDWANYLKAAMQVAASRWELRVGIDAAVVSDLPPAAGLSSSSALLVAFTLALLDANGFHPAIAELMEILPEGEQFVGTRGGGMDHAAVLACQSGCALLINFDPLTFKAIPVPSDWCFLVAHSLTTAEKSGTVNAQYNSRRTAGISGLQKLGLESYREAVARHSLEELTTLAGRLAGAEFRSFLHVASETFRVQECLKALGTEDIDRFGGLLSASHASLRDQLLVSNGPLDALVQSALEAGAAGARLTGAGFGGCAIVLTKMEDRDRIRCELIERYYANRQDFDPQRHLFFAIPSAGALIV
jgi:galactokinase